MILKEVRELFLLPGPSFSIQIVPLLQFIHSCSFCCNTSRNLVFSYSHVFHAQSSQRYHSLLRCFFFCFIFLFSASSLFFLSWSFKHSCFISSLTGLYAAVVQKFLISLPLYSYLSSVLAHGNQDSLFSLFDSKVLKIFSLLSTDGRPTMILPHNKSWS